MLQPLRRLSVTLTKLDEDDEEEELLATELWLACLRPSMYLSAVG